MTKIGSSIRELSLGDGSSSRHINQVTIQQTEQQTKESVIDNLSNELLKLELKKNDSIKSKCVRWIVKNILPGHKNAWSLTYVS